MQLRGYVKEMTDKYICPFCEAEVATKSTLFAQPVNYGEDAEIKILLTATCECGADAVSERNHHFHYSGGGYNFEEDSMDSELHLDEITSSSIFLIGQRLDLALKSQPDIESDLVKRFYSHKVEVKVIFDRIDISKHPKRRQWKGFMPDTYNCRCDVFSIKLAESIDDR